MAVAYRALGLNTSNGGSGTLTMNDSFGQSGDLMIACIAYRGTVDPIGLPTGWTQIQKVFVSNVATNNNASPSLLMAYIQRGSTSPSLTFTGFNNVALGSIVYLTGYDTLSPIDVSTSLLSNSLIATHNTGAITPTRDGGLWLAMACAGIEGAVGAAWSNHFAVADTVLNSMTEVRDASSTFGADVDYAVAYIDYASLSNVDPLVPTNYQATHDRNSRSSLALVAIKPPAAVTATSRSFAVIC